MFYKWAALNNYSRARLKLILEQHENQEIKSIIFAFEQWDDLQNYGNICRTFNFKEKIFILLENFKVFKFFNPDFRWVYKEMQLFALS